jgi:hypothetical protein
VADFINIDFNVSHSILIFKLIDEWQGYCSILLWYRYRMLFSSKRFTLKTSSTCFGVWRGLYYFLRER